LSYADMCGWRRALAGGHGKCAAKSVRHLTLPRHHGRPASAALASRLARRVVCWLGGFEDAPSGLVLLAATHSLESDDRRLCGANK
jgi:hypothetical protein